MWSSQSWTRICPEVVMVRVHGTWNGTDGSMYGQKDGWLDEEMWDAALLPPKHNYIQLLCPYGGSLALSHLRSMDIALYLIEFMNTLGFFLASHGFCDL